MKAKHRRTLKAIFTKPTQGGIVFDDIEALVRALNGEVREGEGSRGSEEVSG
jgi:hypothetical protein